MRNLTELIKTTIIGGVLFLFPVVLISVVLKHAISILHPMLAPLVNALPMEKVAGVATATVIELLLVVFVCLVAGWIARTRIGRRINTTVEEKILNRLPPYRIFKGVLDGFATVESRSGLIPALINIEDAWQLGFILEELGNGMLTAFVPQAPTVMSGNVFYIAESRVKRLDITVGDAYLCVSRLGLGSKDLLKGQI